MFRCAGQTGGGPLMSNVRGRTHMAGIEFDVNDYLSRLDLWAMEDSSNKLEECEYFLGLAALETDRMRFRWLISAFFNAAYSFFEMTALHAYFAFTEPDTGEPTSDEVAIGILSAYVDVSRGGKKSSRVKTTGKHEVTKRLYELRRANTHHFPMSIMAAGPALPEDFHFGNMRGEGTPALAFCREAIALIRQVQRELGT
jgi:hypothetical protein